MSILKAGKILQRYLFESPSQRLLRCVPDCRDDNRTTGLPLILISQIFRSGGTYLSQLFDNHPRIAAHPHELHIGNPKKWHWPDLDNVHSPEQAFSILHERRFRTFSWTGIYRYNKGPQRVMPIVYDYRLQKRLFRDLAHKVSPDCERDWLDVYFDTFFAAWLDHQQRYSEKQYISAFASMLALSPDSMSRFRMVYPDGWLISIIREPVGWYASTRQHGANVPGKRGTNYPRDIKPFAGFEGAEEAYLGNIQAMRDNAELFGERFILLDYGDLVANTEYIMRGLAAAIGLEWSPVLVQQTFNGMPISPNSAHLSSRAAKTEVRISGEEEVRINSGPMRHAYERIRSELKMDPANHLVSPSAAR